MVVVAPAEPLRDSAAQLLASAARGGVSVLVGAGPTFSDDQSVGSVGLEPVLDAFGVTFLPLLVFERDAEAALPTGLGGEVFLATPTRHEITRGLTAGDEPRNRVLMQLSQALDPGQSASALLVTSPQAFGVSRAEALGEPGQRSSAVERERDGPFTVALAAELPAAAGGSARGARLVALGSPSPLLGLTWQDASLAATRRFVESSVAWLTQRPPLVQLPEKPARQVGMHLTEAALAELARYVMIYMPLTALALGGLIVYRRRWTPRGAARRQEGS
jgi:hypothetical protein